MPEVDFAAGALDDDLVLRILSFATEDLREATPASGGPQSPGEAKDLLRQLFEANGLSPPVVEGLERDAPAIAGRTLELLVADEDTAPVVRSLVEAPPQSVQRSALLTSAIVLGALVTWLQTKIDASVERTADGALIWHFRVLKQESDKEVVKSVLDRLSSVLGP